MPLPTVGSSGLSPLWSSEVTTSAVIPGAVGVVQLPSSDWVFRRNVTAWPRAARSWSRSGPTVFWAKTVGHKDAASSTTRAVFRIAISCLWNSAL